MNNMTESIEDVVKRCERSWRRSGVPKRAIASMNEDLAQHLRDAQADGRPVSDVVGPDVEAFAATWAGANPSALPRRRPYGPAYVAFATGVVQLLSVLAISVYSSTSSGGSTSTSVDAAGLLMVCLTIVAGSLAIAGAVVMLRRSVPVGGGLLIAAAPLSLLTPLAWVGSVIYLLAGIFVLGRYRDAR